MRRGWNNLKEKGSGGRCHRIIFHRLGGGSTLTSSASITHHSFLLCRRHSHLALAVWVCKGEPESGGGGR